MAEFRINGASETSGSATRNVIIVDTVVIVVAHVNTSNLSNDGVLVVATTVVVVKVKVLPITGHEGPEGE